MNEPKLRFKADDGGKFPDWEEKSFEQTFSNLNNSTFSRDCLNYENGNVKYIHYGDILVKFGENVDVNNCIVPYVNDDLNCEKYNTLENGDVVIADTAEDETVGKVVEISETDSQKTISGLHTIACRPKEKFASKYLGYFMNSDTYHNQLRPYMQGIKVTSISKANIKLTSISIPSLTEQQKIAEFLSTIDTVIEKQKETVSAWEERKKGVMQKLFSQEVRFKADDGSEFPEWEEKKLNEVGDIVTGNTPSTKQNDYYGECYLWVTPTDITDSREVTSTAKMLTELGYTVARHIPANSILVTCIASIGKNAILRENGSCNQQINSITPYDEYSVEFVYYLICQNEKLLHANAGTGGMEILNKENFSKIKMYFPCLEEQRKIADCLSSLDDVIEKQKATLAAWEELKKGLLQQMFV